MTPPLRVLAADGIDLAAAAAALPGLEVVPAAQAGGDGRARLCLVAPGADADAQAALEAAGLGHLPRVVWNGDPAALVAGMGARLEAALADAGAARRSAALLRREQEALNRRFKALEGLAWALGGPQASLALDWPPGPATATVPEGSATLRQALPVDVSGLAAVDLLLPELTPEEAGEVVVAIEDSEGHLHPLALAATSVERADGWLRFAAETPLPVDPQDGVLLAEGLPEGTIIGLGHPVPDPDFAAHGLEGGDGCTLALRVWKGITGTAGSMAPTAPAVAGLVHERLLPADLPRPALIARPRAARDHVATDFWAKENAVLVHPSTAGPVCARLARVPVAGVQRASAVVHAAHPRSGVLGFAMGFAAPGQATSDNWQQFLGPWTYLAPGSWGEVHAPPQPSAARMGRSCDLLLATCVAGEATNESAWALFRAFRLSRSAPE
ncbi:hypothetical protein GI374_13280 [Paracoccus sp. S-4012]|uniref:DUF6212 domain-containing protein n=1 Tax=Paracoccus sp. S-4012 TaxID=2665648 RepID=UPI0012B0D122|nr:hypothetical protein [Paracoccus sp. S-4012]